jgi:hypothetical protein
MDRNSPFRKRAEEITLFVNKSWSNIEDLQFNEICMSLQNFVFLQEIDFSGNNLGIIGCRGVSQLLENCKFMYRIDLSYNIIDDIALECLSEGIQRSNVLEDLLLARTIWT